MRSKACGLAALIVILSACATPTEMRQTKPTLTLESTKLAKEVGVCIADQWDSDPSSVHSSKWRESKSGYTVSAYCEGMYPCMLADITSIPKGSRTVTYTRGIGSEVFMRAAMNCQ